MIPKVIYQTWYTYELPNIVQKYINEFMQLNPSYTRKMYDDNDVEEFIKNNYEERIYNAYKQLTIGAAKADLWRYLVLYKYGGVYLDIDSHIIANLDDFIKEDDMAIITREKNPGVFVNWCMMFVKEHPLLKLTIDTCIYNIEHKLNKINKPINYIVGPIVLTECINNYFKSLFQNNAIYFLDDSIINETIKNSDLTYKCRFYNYDFENIVKFKHRECDILYTFKPHWLSVSS